jgi:hypothetical protein
MQGWMRTFWAAYVGKRSIAGGECTQAIQALANTSPRFMHTIYINHIYIYRMEARGNFLQYANSVETVPGLTFWTREAFPIYISFIKIVKKYFWFCHLRTNTKIILKHLHHRVDRGLSFFFSRPNWDLPPPQASVPPPPLWWGGGGDSVPTLWYSRYICTLWFALIQWKQYH